jgi:hypothetical protein
MAENCIRERASPGFRRWAGRGGHADRPTGCAGEARLQALEQARRAAHAVALEAEADCKRGGATKLSANARDAIEHAEEAKAAVLSFSAAHRQEVGGLRSPSWNRPILTEIYLCHACSWQEFTLVKVKTARRRQMGGLRQQLAAASARLAQLASGEAAERASDGWGNARGQAE